MTTPDSDPSVPTLFWTTTPIRVLHYTDPAQLPTFTHEINTTFRWDTEVHLNENNDIVWWGGSYRMPLGYWLLNGNEILDGESIRQNYRPLPPDWSEEQNRYFDENPTLLEG